MTCRTLLTVFCYQCSDLLLVKSSLGWQTFTRSYQESRARNRSSPALLLGHLLQPGLLWERSIFFNQSSFFGRHLDQVIVNATAGSCGNFRIKDSKISLTMPVKTETETIWHVGDGCDSDMHVLCVWLAVVLGPEQELTKHHLPLASFSNQVFFDYDPSSSASLLSSVGITTRPYMYTRPPKC